MPLYILVPMILVGLPVVIGLVYLTTKNRNVKPLNPNLASIRFAEDYPNSAVGEVIVSDDGNHAFLVLKAENQVGLVSRMGKNFLTRILSPNNSLVVDANDDMLKLTLDDFTFGGLAVKLKSADDRQNIVRLLSQER